MPAFSLPFPKSPHSTLTPIFIKILTPFLPTPLPKLLTLQTQSPNLLLTPPPSYQTPFPPHPHSPLLIPLCPFPCSLQPYPLSIYRSSPIHERCFQAPQVINRFPEQYLGYYINSNSSIILGNYDATIVLGISTTDLLIG